MDLGIRGSGVEFELERPYKRAGGTRKLHRRSKALATDGIGFTGRRFEEVSDCGRIHSIGPVGDVFVLFWVIEVGNDVGMGIDQGKIPSGGREAEVGMQRVGRIGPVFSRGKHKEITIRGQGDLGKTPFGEVVRVIGQKPSFQVFSNLACVV